MPHVHDTARAFMPYADVPVPHAPAGPLAGLNFAVKDLFHMAGYPTSCGQPLMLALNGVQTRTAPTVQRLLDAGARFVGKVITDELASSMNGNNAHFGAPINGHAPERITGRSSSGSAAAVSNRLADLALGTDTGGSVRAPASHCGLVGIRPTQGRVSLQGCMDLSPSLDTCGWFTRDLPTMPDVAPLRSDPESALEDYRNRAIRLLCMAGLAGLPQLSLPGSQRLGAPLGLSLVGPAGSDRSLVALAECITAAG